MARFVARAASREDALEIAALSGAESAASWTHGPYSGAGWLERCMLSVVVHVATDGDSGAAIAFAALDDRLPDADIAAVCADLQAQLDGRVIISVCVIPSSGTWLCEQRAE